MSDYRPSAALLRTRIISRPTYDQDRFFEAGNGTKPATQAHARQAASLAAQRVVAATARRKPTTEERQKEICRRRRWAKSGSMPPDLRDRFTEAESAALTVIGEQCKRKGFCDLCIDEIASLAGVSRTSVQNALRKASGRSKEDEKSVPVISIRERPQAGRKSFTNIVKILCRSWLGWIGRAIGFKRLSASVTGDKISLSRGVETPKTAFERECVAALRDPLRKRDFVENHSSLRDRAKTWAHSFGGLAHG